MEFHTFGEKEAPAILCIHGMMQPWESLCRLLLPLKEDFCLIFAAMDGAYAGSGDFTTFPDQALQIEDYLQENWGGAIRGAYGISQGALLLTELLARNRVSIETAVLDSTYVAHQGRLSGMVTARLLIGFKHRREDPPRLIHIPLALMGMNKMQRKNAIAAFRDGLCWEASDESIKKNCLENYTYRVDPGLAHTGTRLVLWCGEKEKYAIRSHGMIKAYKEPWQEQIFPGMAHGELLANHTERLLTMLRDLFKKEEKR